jgi:hypothetical protein
MAVSQFWRDLHPWALLMCTSAPHPSASTSALSKQPHRHTILTMPRPLPSRTPAALALYQILGHAQLQQHPTFIAKQLVLPACCFLSAMPPLSATHVHPVSSAHQV